MIDLIVAMQKVLDKSARKSIADWLAPLPKGAAWHVISDYVFDNPDRNDTAAFVVLLHHDKLNVLLEYIDNQAPVDIKKSRSASEGMIRYLTSPVAFSFTFVLEDGDRFLATYSPVTEMIGGLEELGRIAGAMAEKSGDKDRYFTQAQARLARFVADLQRKGNAKLARQVFIVAAFAAVVLDYLDQSTDPALVSWISDRDAILDRHDGVVWDIASILFYVMKGQRMTTNASGETLIHTPRLVHVTPDATGKNELDPLVRMADYLAAAASGMNLTTFEFAHPKLADIGTACFSASSNGALCTVSWTGQGFLVRRLVGR